VRTALVTGASRGIGLGIATSLARQGFGLTITSRTESDLASLSRELQRAGSPHVVARAVDLADRSALPELVSLHRDAFEAMSALILNAGVGTAGPVSTFNAARLDKTFDVNFTSSFLLIQEALPLLRRWAESDLDRGAKIVGMSSIAGFFAEANLAVYGASKAALLSLLEAVNQEESGNGVTATAVAPAFVETDMSAWATDAVPAETMIKVEDVVSVVDMLLGLSRNASITRIVVTRSGTSGHAA
jgi:short-subunit dehydrogenase